jgi:hypothetical protein
MNNWLLCSHLLVSQLISHLYGYTHTLTWKTLYARLALTILVQPHKILYIVTWGIANRVPTCTWVGLLINTTVMFQNSCWVFVCEYLEIHTLPMWYIIAEALLSPLYILATMYLTSILHVYSCVTHYSVSVVAFEYFSSCLTNHQKPFSANTQCNENVGKHR